MSILYYYEFDGDKYLGEYDENNYQVVLLFCNAKFFESLKMARKWHDKMNVENDFRKSKLVRFEATNFLNIEEY